MKESLLLIDGNSLIHRAYHALPPLNAPDGRPVGAVYGVSSMILTILMEGVGGFTPTHITVAFDRPEETFRKKAYSDYKGTRKETPEDLIQQIIEMRRVCEVFSISFFEEPGWEADDIIATLVKQYAREVHCIVLSSDMDILQTISYGNVSVVAPQKGINNTTVYTAKNASEKFGVSPDKIADYKGLAGDASDNIPGVKGIGPKSAKELITKYGSIEDIYAEIDEIGIIETKAQEKLIRSREQALLSKKLAVLHTEIPLTVSLEDLRFEKNEALYERLRSYFDECGFTSLIPRLNRYYNKRSTRKG